MDVLFWFEWKSALLYQSEVLLFVTTKIRLFPPCVLHRSLHSLQSLLQPWGKDTKTSSSDPSFRQRLFLTHITVRVWGECYNVDQTLCAAWRWIHPDRSQLFWFGSITWQTWKVCIGLFCSSISVIASHCENIGRVVTLQVQTVTTHSTASTETGLLKKKVWLLFVAEQ